METTKTGTLIESMVPQAPLQIVLGGITSAEFNGVVATTEPDMVQAIKGYIRTKVLKQFGVAEIEKTVITGGKLYFNNGNRTALKLPAVKLTPSGAFSEDLEGYYNRVKPDITKWLVQSGQNASITMELVGTLN